MPDSEGARLHSYHHDTSCHLRLSESRPLTDGTTSLRLRVVTKSDSLSESRRLQLVNRHVVAIKQPGIASEWSIGASLPCHAT
jgi:hypothetical protein